MKIKELAIVGKIAPSIERAISDVVDSLPPTAYAVDVHPDSAIPNGITVLIRPTTVAIPRARFTLSTSPDADTVWITIGEDLQFELPIDPKASWRPTGLKALEDEVRALCGAALSGRVTEKIWRVGDKVVRAEGIVSLPHVILRPVHSHGNVRDATATTINYAPYAQDA